MNTVRFAKAFDSNGKEIAIHVTGGVLDATDQGHTLGSYTVQMSDPQFARLSRLVNQADGDIPYEVRPSGKGVRIYQF